MPELLSDTDFAALGESVSREGQALVEFIETNFSESTAEWRSAELQQEYDRRSAVYDADKARYIEQERARNDVADHRRRREELQQFQTRSRHAGRQPPGRENRRHEAPNNERTADDFVRAWLLRARRRHVDVPEIDGLSIDSPEINIRAMGSFGERMERRANPRFEQRAMSSITASTGGVLVGSSMADFIDEALLDFSGVLQICNVLETPSGEPLVVPTLNDTANKGSLLNENSAANVTDPSLASITFSAYKFDSDTIKIPYELLMDTSLPNVISTLQNSQLTRLGRNVNTRCTTGTGANEPRGVVTASTLGVTAAGAAAITVGEMISLEHSVDPQYRRSPKAAFMAHDSVWKYLRQLLDSTGRPLWQPSMQAGMPDNWNGRPIYVNQDMASSVATTNKTVLFGDFSKYVVRFAGPITVQVFNELYAESGQIGIKVFRRVDGNLIDAGTRPIKYLQQA